ALPLAALASTVFPLTLLLRSVVGPKTLMPPPRTSTEPNGAVAWTWLSLMRLLVIVPLSKTLAPPRAVAFPAAELTSTRFRGMRTLVRGPPTSPAPERPPASPKEPGRAIAVTLLSLITSLLSAQGDGGQMSMARPPWLAKAPPAELVVVAALPEIVVLLIDTVCASPFCASPLM